MSSEANVQLKRCFECGYDAVAGDGTWARIIHPSFGSITQCPECGSTNIQSVE